MIRIKVFIIPALFLILSLNSLVAQELYTGQVYANIEKSTNFYTKELALDFYTAKEPKNALQRPLIVLVHGGGFAGGKKDNPEETKFSQLMASKGFAVASISYTLTRKGKPNGFGCNCPAEEKMYTFKKTTEDILKAIAFLKDNDRFTFDSSRIVLVGSSAGAEGVLNTAYLKHHPDFRKLNTPFTDIAAVISLAGAVIDARYITQDNAVPALLIHGKKDNLVPYGTAPHHYCDPNKVGYFFLDGSQAIANRLKEVDGSYHLLTDPEGNHDWAGLGYQYVDDIAHFINEVVVKQNKIQTKEEIRRN